MYSAPPLPFLLRLLVPAAFVLAAFAGAQSLEHRPPPPNPEPAKPLPSRSRRAVPPREPASRSKSAVTIPSKSVSPSKRTSCIRSTRTANSSFPGTPCSRAASPPCTADTKTRWHARLRGDFTPYHTVQVQFDKLKLPSGTSPHRRRRRSQRRPRPELSAPGVSPKQSFIAPMVRGQGQHARPHRLLHRARQRRPRPRRCSITSFRTTPSASTRTPRGPSN